MIESRNLFRVGVLIAASVATPLVHGQSNLTATMREQDRQQLQQLQDKAVALRKLEQKNPTNSGIHEERIQAFAAAALGITNYAIKYTKPLELDRLLLMYRMAVNLELAEEITEAKAELESCETHPLYHSTGALYDGERIDVLVPERVLALTAIIHVPPTGRVWMVPTGEYVVTTNVRGSVPDGSAVHANSHDLGNFKINPESLRGMQGGTGSIGRH